MLKKYILIVLLVLSLLIGCSGPRPGPEEVIAKAIEAINELQTYRFESTNTATMGEITVHGNLQGEFVSPDRLHLIIITDGETEEGIRIGKKRHSRSRIQTAAA